MMFPSIKAIMNVNTEFKKFEDKKVELTLPKMLYAFIHMITVGILLYKFSVMGLIPSQPVDWVTLIPLSLVI